MLLYLEDQLEQAYKLYCKHQARKDLPFMKLEDFRSMFEDLMTVIYTDEEEDGNTF
jgi:hypothetical protein